MTLPSLIGMSGQKILIQIENAPDGVSEYGQMTGVHPVRLDVQAETTHRE
jgi:hypothetical protein